MCARERARRSVSVGDNSSLEGPVWLGQQITQRLITSACRLTQIMRESAEQGVDKHSARVAPTHVSGGCAE
jgi:hypothetical protein